MNLEIFKMFGSVFLKDEASDKLDNLEDRGRRTGIAFDGLGRAALKASALIGAIGSASAGAVSASAPLLAGVGALGASFASAGIGAVAFGAVAVGALAPVIEGAENLTESQQKARDNLESFQTFWQGFVKQFETPIFDIFSTSLDSLQKIFEKLAPTITGVSSVVTDLSNKFNEALDSGGAGRFFDWLSENAPRSLENFSMIFGNTLTGVFGLLEAFTPLGISMEEGLLRLTQRFTEWSNSLSESEGFKSFITYVQENTPRLMELLNNLWTIIVGAIQTLAPLGTVVLDILNNIFGSLQGLAPFLQTIVQKAIEFATVISTNWSTVENIVVGIGTAVGAFVAIMKGLQIIAVINALMVAYRAGTLAATLAQYGLNAAMLANPITWVVALIAGLIAIGVLLYKNWDTVTAKAKELWSKVKEAWNLIKTAITVGAQESWNAVKEKFTGIVNTAGEKLNAARSKVAEVWGLIKTAFSTGAQESWNALKEKFTGMVNSAREKMNDVKSKIQDGWNNVKSFLGGINLYDIGKNIIQGMINGIGSMASKLVSKAKGVVNDAINGAKRLLGIKSPSRVFMEIGKFTGEGMEIGLDKSKAGVERASKELAVSTVKGTASGYQNTTSSANVTKVTNSEDSTLLQSVARMLENFKVDLYMSDSLVGSAVAPTVSNAQGQTISRNRFFAGGDKK